MVKKKTDVGSNDYVPGITVPIIPGIMPIATYQTFRRILNLCKIKVPKHILDDLDSIKVRKRNESE